MIARIAWRNLWRNRRRTMLTVTAIGLGLVVLITLASFVEGMLGMMVEQMARSSIGHIQIHHPDYLEKRNTQLVMDNGGRIIDIAEKVEGVEALSSRMLLTGSIRSSRSSTVRVVFVFAVDPVREKNFSALAARVVEGGFVVPPPETLDPDAPDRVKQRKGILLGVKLAKQLKVELGSKIRLDTAGFKGTTAASAFYVTGILETGSDIFDRQTVMVALNDMQEVTGAGDVVHEITVIATSSEEIPIVVKRLHEAIAAQNADKSMGPVQVLPWWEVSPEIEQIMQMSEAWTGVLYMLMLVILSAGILTTMYMVVFERRHEFGILLALGTRPRRLFAELMLEALYIAGLSVMVGLAFGAVSVSLLVVYGLDLSMFMEGFEFAGMFVENVYYGSAALEVFAEPTIVVFIGTILFALWPALRVARMKPLDGISGK